MRLAVAVARRQHGGRRLRGPAAILKADSDVTDIARHPIVDALDLEADIGRVADDLGRELSQGLVRLRHRRIALVEHGGKRGVIGEAGDLEAARVVKPADDRLARLWRLLPDAHMMNDPIT